jgi:spore germination protein KC
VDTLKTIEYSIDLLSKTEEVRIIDVSEMLDDPSGAAVIPTLKIKDLKSEKLTGQMPEKDLTTCGYAVLKGFSLAGYIDDEIALGYNFLVNRVKSCPVSVPDETGLLVGLEVIKSKTTVEAQFNGDELERVVFQTYILSISRISSRGRNIYTEEATEKLESEQSECDQIPDGAGYQAFKEARVDCIASAEAKDAAPIKWEKHKDKWNEIYPDLEIEANVESDIQRTYDIHEPNGYQRGS